MNFEVRHSLPGRIRIFLPDLHADPFLGGPLASFLRQQEGVTAVRISRHCASVTVESKESFERFLSPLSLVSSQDLFALASAAPEREQVPSTPTQVSQPENSFRLSTASLLLSAVPIPALQILHLPLLIWNALPTWKKAWSVLRQEKRLNVDFLDGVAISVALSQRQVFTPAFIIWLISLGDWIRNLTAGKSRQAMTDVLEYQRRSAWVVRDEGPVEVLATEIRQQDIVLVYAGDMIPVDGEVDSGVGTVDQKMVTGESMPVLRREGDQVYAGTVLREGKLKLIASRVGSATAAAQIAALVESAPKGETRAQNYAQKYADRLVAPWLAVSLGTFAATRNVERLVAMTIIDYGTGIRVAAPTSILASMAAAARQGILIKGGSQMEKLAEADTVIFDKTGTLTRGMPEVVDVLSYKKRAFPQNAILQIAAALEQRVNHPIAEAIVRKAQQKLLEIPERQELKYEIGMGVEAQVNGYYVHLGSRKYLAARGIRSGQAGRDIKRLDDSGFSTIVMAINGQLVGAVACADQIRPESRDVIAALHGKGVKHVMMVTGDTTAAAHGVALQLGMDQVFAETMPDQKATIVRDLQAKGRKVVMVGDGINDSPALAYADVGVAMKNGADIAHQSADVVLMDDNLWKLVAAFDFSRDAMKLIRQNYAIIVGLNTLAAAMVLPGTISAGVIAAISNGSAILASANGIRPLISLRLKRS